MKLTIEKFLKDGHLFQEGDLYKECNGHVYDMNYPASTDCINTPMPGDDERFVVKARCLMLPKHFRLYQDVKDGNVAVVNKLTEEYMWSVSSDVLAVALKCDTEEWIPIKILLTYNVKPIISFAQLEN